MDDEGVKPPVSGYVVRYGPSDGGKEDVRYHRGEGPRRRIRDHHGWPGIGYRSTGSGYEP